jgi:glucose/mannose-6-phosphate isomerase
LSLLDDERALREGDPGGMLDAVADLSRRCRVGYDLGRTAEDLPSGEGVTGIAFCGMGGSAVAGDVLRSLYADRQRIPVVVVRTPELPEWCGPHSIVIVSSYSGDTAETLACFEEAVRRGCRIVAVTSGGTLARRAAELALAVVTVPGGSQPRAALGYLALGCLGALESVGLLPPVGPELDETIRELEALAAQLAPGVPTDINPAKQLAEAIGERVPVIWGAEGIGSVAAARWKTQCNENGKVPAWAASLPELDHNEVVGWSNDRGRGFFLVTLRHEGEHPEIAPRFPLSVQIAIDAGIHAQEVWAHGRSSLSRLLTLIMVGDFTATYLGLARGVDPTPVAVITRLKAALADR